LRHGDDPRKLALRGDVTEADGGEDGDGEIERIGPAECFGEAVRLVRLDLYIHRGEHQQQHRQADRDGLDRPQPGTSELRIFRTCQATTAPTTASANTNSIKVPGSSGRSNGAR